MRLLVVEDDEVLSDGLKAGLGLIGASVEVVGTCDDARAAIKGAEFDAILLDLMLPDGSGLDVLTEMRARGERTPVLLLTALDQISDRIKGLDAGADDYVGKPFDLDELGARLRAVARRQEGRATPFLACGRVNLDLAQMTVSVDGSAVHLSRREFMVLQALMERPGLVRSKSHLEERLYGWQEDVESNTVEVHVHKLRTKLGRQSIETVRGIGYRMRIEQ